MTVAALPLGNGINLDVNESTVQEGSAVSMYNCYVDRMNALRIVPGCVEYVDTGAGNYRTWSYYSTDLNRQIIVSGGRIWGQTEKAGTITEITDAVLTLDERPTFAEDGVNIFVAANSRIHKIVGDTAVMVGNLSPRNVTSLVYIGGYLMAKGDEAVGGVAGDTHYSDNKVDGYAAWEVYNNESRPDALQSLVVAYEQIYNIGRNSLEVSFIDGTVPFSVNKNAAQHFGTPAAKSVAFDGQSIYYLSEIAGSRKIVELKGGGTPGIVSFPVDVPLETFERIDDAEGFIMAFRGQNGYAITFPTANAVVDDQFWHAITLFYHLQSKQWIILGKWNAAEGEYSPYRGCSFTYIEPWGLRLIGGRDGKLYLLQDTLAEDYAAAPVLQHRWRDNGSTEWKLGRNIPMGELGQTAGVPRINQCGRYRQRQHQIVYSDLSDAGEPMRAAIKTGNIDRGNVSREKQSNTYYYDIQRGKPEFVLNVISEDFDVLRA